MSRTILASYQGTPGLGSAAHITVHETISNTTVVARTNAGIVERQSGSPGGASGFYVWQGTVPDGQAWDAVWDEGAAASGKGALLAMPQIVGALTGGIQDGTTGPGIVFVIKRGDSSPSIAFQCKQAGVAVDLTTAASVLFKMKPKPSTPAGLDLESLTVNRAGRFEDRVNGIVAYDWQHSGADTAVADEYDAEFEVTYADGSVETFPTTDPDTDQEDEYLTVKIPLDLDAP